VSDPELYEWLVLRRVRDGGVAKSAGVYFDHGRPTPGHLAGVFDRLIWTGLVTVAEGNPIWELRRRSLTDNGAARYATLGERRQRQAGLAVPPPEHSITTETAESPADRRSGTAAFSSGQSDPTVPSHAQREGQRDG